MIFALLCVLYAMVIATMAWRTMHGRTEPKVALSHMTRFSAIALPLLMVIQLVLAFIRINWIGAIILTPFTVMGVVMSRLIWKMERLTRS